MNANLMTLGGKSPCRSQYSYRRNFDLRVLNKYNVLRELERIFVPQI